MECNKTFKAFVYENANEQYNNFLKQKTVSNFSLPGHLHSYQVLLDKPVLLTMLRERRPTTYRVTRARRLMGA